MPRQKFIVIDDFPPTNWSYPTNLLVTARTWRLAATP
jgi:hypothetical protein